jgi:hypothetical protein
VSIYKVVISSNHMSYPGILKNMIFGSAGMFHFTLNRQSLKTLISRAYSGNISQYI